MIFTHKSVKIHILGNKVKNCPVLSCFEQSSIVWIGRIPIFKFPGCAISPPPDFLLLKVCAPKPALVFWPSFPYSLNNEIIEGIRVDRCQVSALLLTEGLSVPPVFLGSTPEVALVSILLPVLVTGFSASWWWYIKKVRQGLRCCSAQWSRCQLGCSCSQNFPCKLGSCYRSILSEIRVWKSQKKQCNGWRLLSLIKMLPPQKMNLNAKKKTFPNIYLPLMGEALSSIGIGCSVWCCSTSIVKFWGSWYCW